MFYRIISTLAFMLLLLMSVAPAYAQGNQGPGDSETDGGTLIIPDDWYPTVTITNPTNGSQVPANTSITCRVSAQEGSTGADLVRCYYNFTDDEGNSFSKTSYSAPDYPVVWNTGLYNETVTIWARIYDETGRYDDHTITVYVVDGGTLPSDEMNVSITNPDPGDLIAPNSSISVTSYVTMNPYTMSPIDRVSYSMLDQYGSGVTLTSYSGPSYPVTWSVGATEGPRTITATAYADNGESASSSISITVGYETPPPDPSVAVTITNPQPGETLPVNTTIRITSLPTLNPQTMLPIDRVEYWILDDLAGGQMLSSGVGPDYAVYWNTGQFEKYWTITATIYDDGGSTGTDQVRVLVSPDAEEPGGQINPGEDGIIKIGSTFYSTLQEAYNAASSGATIYCKRATLSGGITSSASKTVTIAGGYDNSWSSIIGKSTITGAIVMNAGQLIFRNCCLNQGGTVPGGTVLDENRVFVIGDVVKDFLVMEGGASGYQLVQIVNPAHIGEVADDVNAPFWWKFYADFWDDNNVHISDKADNYYYQTDEFIRDDVNQTIGISPYGTAYLDATTSDFANAAFYDTRVGSTYEDLSGNEYMGWQHHYRRRIEAGALPDMIPGWTVAQMTLPLPTYYQWDNFGSQFMLDFRIELGNYIWFIDNGQGIYNPGYCEWIMPGEVRKDGWGIIPTTELPLQTQAFYEWMYIVPEGQTISVGVPPECTVSDYDPTIVDPQSMVWLLDDAWEEVWKELNELQAMGYGGVTAADIAKEGTYVYVDEFGEAYVVSLEQAKMLAEQDDRAIAFMNGSNNSLDAATQNAIMMAISEEAPVILTYMAQGLDYANANDDAAVTAFTALLSQLEAVDIPTIVVGHSWSAHLVAGAISGDNDYSNLLSFWAINPAHRYFQGADQAWESYLQTTSIETIIFAGQWDPLSKGGLGVGFMGTDLLGHTYVMGDQDVYNIVTNRSIIYQYVISEAGHGIIHMYRHGLGIFTPQYNPWYKHADANNLIPDDFYLSHNYPNPFNPSTTIEFGLPKNAQVRLNIYNILGQKVTTLIDKEMAAGHHQVVWDGDNGGGQSVATGIYFYRIQSDDFVESKKMLLLK